MRTGLAVAVSFSLSVLGGGVSRATEPTGSRTVLDTLCGDLRWAGRTVVADVKAVVTAPLRVAEVRNVSARTWLTAAAWIVGIGATIALDDPLRDLTRRIDDDAAETMQTVASTLSYASVGALYLAGLARDDERWRHSALTGAESLAVVPPLVKLTKLSFGRQRPDANRGPTAWFEDGESFVSDAASPPFAAAEAVSEALDHAWWATIPAYATAVAVGLGRMGQDRHWASDIVGSAALGVGTTRVFTAMHRSRDEPEPRLAFRPFAGPNRALGLQVTLRF